MASKPIPITTIADVLVASAVSLFLLAGVRCLAISHSFVLIHQLSTQIEGKYADLVDEVKNSTELMRTLQDIYTQKTTLKPKRLKRALNNEVVFTSDECVKYGFVNDLFALCN